MSFKSMLLASSAVAALSAGAFAQDASADTNDDDVVEEIVVTGLYTTNDRIDTATGLGLTLRETPQSVTVITAQRILDQNLDTVADVVVNAVGVSVNEVDDVRNTFNARGFEINNYQVDGVPLAWTLAGGAGETMADVSIYERVEIVRGATGLLTGAGDPSASINLVRKHANSKEFTGYVSGGFGSWNNWQVSADVGGALNESGSIRGRAVVKYEEGENFIDLFEDKKAVFYGVIDADITENTLFRVGASHQEESPTAPAWGALPSWYSDGSFAVWPRSQTSSADWTYWDTQNQNIFANLSHTFSNGWEIVFNYNWLRNAEQTEILYISGQPDKDTGLGLFSYPFKDDGESIQNSFDIQLKGEYGLFGRDHEFVVGALHSKQKLETTTFDALAFPAPGNFNEWDGSFPNPGFSETGNLAVDMDTKQTGIYGATRINVSDAFKVIAGGRLASWDRKGVNYSPEFDFGDDGVFVPYAGLLYDVTENHRVYASYTEIFQPQNAQDRNGEFLAPIVGKSYEVGLKSSFLDDALQTSVAVFRIEQDNLAAVDPGHFIPGTPFEASRAVEGATSEGFEVEVIGQPAEGWNISLGYSLFEVEDANGAKVNTDHPRQLLNLFTTYRLPGAFDGLVLGAGVNWRSKNYTDANNPVTGEPFRLEQGAFALVNLMARYEINEHLSLQANVENLTDKTYYSQIGFYSQYRYGAPRSYFVSLNYGF
ncbi:TonB-dependent siderophore receptor [Kordiimonas gwangyangensis]|uniref:TonB-dependent siderophore receptor n=1 Tax=Kordiimonas gwangyangensis TaxID=288022 RepID=UPI0003720C2E|nr:TonB-dependent siderophore receptor [Kordiimonas gwangyangensis]